MQELTVEQVDEVEGGAIMVAIGLGLALGTLIVGCYVLWDSTR